MEIFLLLQIMTIFSNQKIRYQITKKKRLIHSVYCISHAFLIKVQENIAHYFLICMLLPLRRENSIWFRIVCRHSAFLSLGLTCPHVWLSIRNSRIQYLHRLVVRWAMRYEIIRTDVQHAMNIDRHYILTHDDKMYDSNIFNNTDSYQYDLKGTICNFGTQTNFRLIPHPCLPFLTGLVFLLYIDHWQHTV